MKFRSMESERVGVESLPARGAWIEINSQHVYGKAAESLPARGAWIEISMSLFRSAPIPSRSPQGERGLKLKIELMLMLSLCRSPQGERGLKFTRKT